MPVAYSAVGCRPNSPPQTISVLVQQAALLQVFEQAGDRLVGLAGVEVVVRHDVVVRVPGRIDVVAAAVDLDEAHAALDEPPRHQALAAEHARLACRSGRTAS